MGHYEAGEGSGGIGGVGGGVEPAAESDAVGGLEFDIFSSHGDGEC